MKKGKKNHNMTAEGLCVCMYVCIRVCDCVYVCGCMCVHVCLCVHLYARVCYVIVCVHVWSCMCVHVCGTCVRCGCMWFLYMCGCVCALCCMCVHVLSCVLCMYICVVVCVCLLSPWSRLKSSPTSFMSSGVQALEVSCWSLVLSITFSLSICQPRGVGTGSVVQPRGPYLAGLVW